MITYPFCSFLKMFFVRNCCFLKMFLADFCSFLKMLVLLIKTSPKNFLEISPIILSFATTKTITI